MSNKETNINKFIMAAGEGHLDDLRCMIGAGEDINQYDEKGRTALMMATSKGQLGLVHFLIESGAEIDQQDYCGQTALMRACRCYRQEILMSLLSNGANVNLQDINGWTALFYAVQEGQLGSVELLLKSGADVCHKDKMARSSLMAAVETGINKKKIIHCLLEQGIDLNASDDWGRSALMYAITGGIRCSETNNTNRYNLLSFSGFLEESFCPDDIIQNPCCTLDINGPENGEWIVHFFDTPSEIVRFLIDSGAEIQQKDKHGWTALMYAVAEGDLDILKYLIEQKGIDAFQEDKYHGTPLLAAAFYGHQEVVRYLIGSGIKKRQLFKNQIETAYSYAVLAKHKDIASYLKTFV